MKKNTNTKLFGLALTTALALTTLTACGRSAGTASLPENSNTTAPIQAESNGSVGTVLLSVNPEIEMDYDGEGNVVALNALNDDGKTVLTGYTGYEGKPCTTVIGDLVGQINAGGYFDTTIDGHERNIVLKLERGSAYPSDQFLNELAQAVQVVVKADQIGSQTVALDDVHAAEIKEYLDLLDLTREIDVLHLPDVSTKSGRTVIAQPGLRYAQADALIRSLLLDETFSVLSLAERTAVQQRILTEIKGRMLEDIVLLETKLATPKKQVFVLQFPVGEFDMVVFDPEAGSCRIFEIKHSEEAASQQYRHLIDEQKCAQTEHRYGPITGKFVLYRGENQEIEGIQYQNVEEYLRTLVP